MSVIEKLKSESMKIRKARGELASFSVFALNEINKIGKSNGDRDTTENEAITVVKKMIATNESSLSLVDGTAKEILSKEIILLKSILPTMANMRDVKQFLENEFEFSPSNKGVIMKALKAEFGSLVDMKEAGVIASQMYDF